MRCTMWMRAAFAVAAVTFANISTQAESLKVAYNQWAGFAPIFVAAEKGYFKDAGLDVEFVPFPGPGDSLAPLLAGHLDVSLTTPDNVVAMNANGGDIVCTYMIDMSNGADALVGKTSIATPADLKGKRIAATVGEVNHLLLLLALRSAGLTADDVTIVNMNPHDAGAAFVAGNLDAAVTWEPWVSKANSAGGHTIFSSANAPNLILDVVAVSRQTLASKKAAIKSFVSAMDKGLAFMKSNPDEAYPLAGKWLDVSGDEVKAMLDGVKLYTMKDNTTIFKDRTPIVEPLKTIAAFLASQGRIDAAPDVQKMVAPEIVLPAK